MAGLWYVGAMSAAGRSRRILEGPLALEVARFGAPLALGMALQTTFNLVDAWILGHLPSAEVGAAMGALGICDQVAALGTILSYGVSTATAARVALAKGAGDDERVRRVTWQSLIVVLALAVVFGVGGALFGPAIVRDVVGAKGEVAAVAADYLRVIVGGSFSIFFLFQLASIQRALGSAKAPAALLVLGNVINVVLAIVLVFGPEPPAPFGWAGPIARALGAPRMGMVGAAWATVIARTAVLLPNGMLLTWRFRALPARGARAPDPIEIRALLTTAWPSSLQLVMRIAAMLVVSSAVARAFTTAEDQTASTAIGLVFRLDTMVLFVGMGWGSAAQTFVGQCLGAKNPARARRSGLIAAGYDALTSALLWWAVARFGRDVLALFDADPAPLAIATRYLAYVAPSYVAVGAGIVLANAITGSGATRTAFAVDAGVLALFQIPACAVVAAIGAPIEALFAVVSATGVVSVTAFVVAYLHGGWMKAARVDAGAEARQGSSS